VKIAWGDASSDGGVPVAALREKGQENDCNIGSPAKSREKEEKLKSRIKVGACC